MKQEANKKNKKWLWLVIGLVALLAVAGIVLALMLPGQQNDNTGTVDAELYWNVDGEYYLSISDVSGFSGRTAAEDGNYYITFAYEGQQVERQIIDKQLVNFIDNMTVVGLIFDADGVVVDAVSPETVATETAKDFYVQRVEGNTVTLNSSRALNGMALELELTDAAGIYDVTDSAEFVGAEGQLGVMDRVLIYSDLADENVTHVYILEHPVDADIYWRVERLYDTDNAVTTRVPDENGVYTMEFAHEGEIVELKCKDAQLVTDIDSRAILMGQFAFIFDEEGYIVEMADIAMALRGKQMASDYHITAIDGDTYTATRISSGTDQGKTVTFTLAEDCDIFQVCQFGCYDHNCGERTDSLQMLDRVNIYGNVDDEAVLIFVTRRIVSDQFYYNYNRQYGGTEKGTNRTKQSDGYYHFELLLDGKVKTVRAKKELADQMDAITSGCMGLELDGNVVQRVYNAGCVTGGTELGAVVTMISGPVMTLTSVYSGNSWNVMMSGDCKVYNAMTGEYGKTVGGTDEVMLGDNVMTFRNYANEACIIFVKSRAVDGAKVYYNLSRLWDNDKQETKRVPNEEGYYEFLMACEGKQVTVKTKSKGMATFIDQQLAPLVGLKVNSSGVITNAYSVDSVIPNSGKACNYRYVENVTNTSFNTYYIQAADQKRVDDTTTWTIAKDCKVYNVSTAFSQFRGEKSTLKNGDYIQAIRDYTTNEITQIFIMQRDPTYGVASYKAYCDHCGKTVTWQPYGGKDIPVADAHYFLCVDLATSQKSIGLNKDKDNEFCDIVLDLKGYTLTSTSRAFLVYDSLTIMDTKGGGKLVGMTPNANGDATSGSCIMVGEEGKLNIMGGELTISDKSTAFGAYGGVLYIGTNAQVTMSGGKIHGGTATTMGGNVAIMGGSFTMTGGVIEKGTAPNGAAIRVNSGSFTMTGGTVDGSITKGTNAVVELSGAPVIKGAGLTVTAGTKLDVSKLSKDASVAVQATGIFTDVLENPNSWLNIIKPGAEGDKIIIKNGALCYIVSGPPSFVLDQDGDGMAVCPVCGGEEVAWVAVTAGERAGTGLSGHYYIKDDSTSPHTQYATTIASDAVVCLHMNGKTVTTAGRIATVGSGGTINIMGEGKIIGSGSYTGEDQDIYTLATLVAHSGGTIGLYGDVTVTTTAAGKAVVNVPNGNIKLYGNASVVPMDGGEGIVIEKGKLTVSEGWTGSALVKFPTALTDGVVSRTNGASTGNFTGSLTLDAEGNPKLVAYKGALALEGATGSGSDFVLDDDGDGKAVCPACGGEEVAWTPVTAGDRVGTGASGHFYIAEDGAGPNAQYATTTVKEDILCIHMNGKNLTTSGRIATVGSGGTINIMGQGTITALGTAEGVNEGALVANSGGTINLYDNVTVTTTAAGKPVVLALNNGKINLYGASTVIPMADGEGIDIQKGKLTVAEGWTGSALVKFPAALMNGVVPAANGASTGDFTGTLTLDAEGSPKLVAKDGGLAVKTEEDTEGKLVLDANKNGFCEACGKTVQWTELNALSNPRIGYLNSKPSDVAAEDYVISEHYHFYLSADLDYTNEVQFAERYYNVNCLHLNGYNLSVKARLRLGLGATMNVMGSGSITGSCNSTNANYNQSLFYLNGGAVLNLYGGTYTSTNDEAPAILLVDTRATVVNVCGDVTVNGGIDAVSGTVALSGNANVDSIALKTNGKLSVAGDWTGTATVKFASALVDGVVPAANGASTGDFTGTLTLNAEGKPQLIAQNGGLAVKEGSGSEEESANPYHKNLTLDAEGKALCPVCNTTVQWTAVTDTYLGSNVTDGGHYYLANDFVSTSQFLTMTGGKTVCFHLNGKNLTYPSRMFVTGATLNIMGTGTVTSTSTTADQLGALVAAYGNGIINLYGGTYKTTNPNGMPVVKVYSSITAKCNVYDGVTIESVEVHKGTLKLSGNANIGAIYVTTDGVLSVAGDWTGTATVKFASELVDGAVPAANGVSTGDFTGTLTLAAEGDPKLVAMDGGLVVGSDAQAEIARAKAVIKAASAMDFSDADNLPTTCPACGAENVTWTAVATNARIGDAATGHYYLPDDVNCPAGWTQYVTAKQDSTVCLHLNGKNLTYGGRIGLTYTGSTLNIMGTGTVTSTGECTNATYNTTALYVGAENSTLNLYGGTYTATRSGQYVLQTKTATTAVVNIYDTVVLVDGSTTDPAATRVADPTVAHTVGTVNMYGGQIKNGTGTAGGNVSMSNGTVFNMYAGSITDGIGNYGGNVRLDVNTQFNLMGGTISGGTSSGGGGNVYSKGTLTVDGGTISGGTATGGSGGSVCAYAGTVNLVSGSITGGQTTENGTHGGNISLTGASTLNMSGGSITGGIARYQAGNLHVASSTVIMTGGEISGGTATTATNHNVWLYGTSTMTLTGGVVKGTDGTTSNGTAIYMYSGTTLNLGGTASVVRADGVRSGNIYVAAGAKLNVLNDWVGTASVKFPTAYADGAEVVAADGQCGSLSGNVFTAGGSYEGRLLSEAANPQQIVGADGKLTVNPDHSQDNVLKVLGIGNSYTIDSMHLLYEIYKAEKPEQQVQFGFLYYGGCSLAQHAQFIGNNEANYVYYKMNNATGRWEQTASSTVEAALKDEQWDIVTMQQSSANSGKPETYNADIQTIQNYVKETLGYTPEFLWNMTWAYAEGYSNSYYVDNGSFSQAVMYKAITDTVQAKILTDSSFSGVIPAGTAIQNARTYWDALLESDAVDHQTYAISRPDGTHLTNLGRFIAAYTWYCTISGETVDTLALTEIPSYLRINWGVYSYTATDIAVIAEAVRNAIAAPYAVTASTQQ